jgi:hypothetical protein
VSFFSIGVPIQTLTANAPCMELLGINTFRVYLFEVHITLTTAPGAGSEFGIGQSQAEGLTPTLQLAASEDMAVLQTDVFPFIATAWVTPPTVPTQFYRTAMIDNAVGEGIVWQFPAGLVVSNGSSLVLWNLSAIGQANVNFVWDV